MFFNTFLPSNVGGDVVRGVLIAREALPRGFVIASLLADRALGLLCLAAIGAVALAAGHGRPGLAATLAAASLAATAATPAAARAALRRLGCGTAAPPPRLARAFAPLLETVAAPRRLLPLLLCGGAAQALRVWQNVFVIRALALDIPEAAVWGIIPVFGIVSALPLTIGGLGLRECAARALAGPAGLDAAHLTALSLAGHAMVTLVNLPGIVPFLRRRRTGDQ